MKGRNLDGLGVWTAPRPDWSPMGSAQDPQDLLFAQDEVIDVSQPDLAQFPRFKEAIPLDFDLLPGEMLYIPVHWWHVTEVNGFQISVTHFWKAKLQCWTFPTPGFHVVAREILFQTKKALTRVSTKPKKQKSSAY